ncbi:MAG: Ig-like domain-containing protein, partial [Candidatus Hinthialibacter sp.]
GYPNSLIGDIKITDASGKARQPAAPESIYSYRMDDGCFHTTGCIPDPALERFYAFHSFDDGPCMMFTLFKAQEDLQLHWSGLPLYFYVREGLTGSRSLYSAQGTQKLDQESLLESGWWCVDDRIGAIFSSAHPVINIQRSTGYNWARKESYKDKCDGVWMSPLQNVPMKQNEAFALPAVFYTHTPHQKLAALHREGFNHASVPEGWMCSAAGDPLQEGRRYLAVSHFYGNKSQAILRFPRRSTNQQFFFPEGAPVLSLGTELTGQGGMTAVALDALDSIGETIDMYAEILNGKTIFAVKQAMGVYQFTCSEPGLASLRLRYRGDKNASYISNAHIASPGVENSELRPVIDQLLNDKVDFVDVRFEDELTIDLGLGAGDHTGPAVEIHDLSIREDQRVKIEVMASDRNGVQSVNLYCDGTLVSEKANRPFLWTHRPGPGYHTYYATAKDSSKWNNTRSSYKQTVKVE